MGDREGRAVTDAVIFVPPGGFDVAAARCLDYCAAKKYHVVGIVRGDWPAAAQMIRNGLAAVIVVSSLDQLEPDREPRIEVVPRRLPNRRSATRPVRFNTRVAG
jgi:hypothetical protein